MYRKPTFTDSTIPQNSVHPINHKLAAFNSMIDRAFKLPLSKIRFKQELNTIKKIAINNGFMPAVIDKICKKWENKKLQFSIYPQVASQEENIYISLTYYGNISDKIGHLFKKHKLKVAFKPASKLSYCLFNAKDHINPLNKSGVYKLTCKCNSIYIGQTGRNFNIRLKEHCRAFNSNLDIYHSTFSEHLKNCNHISSGFSPNSDCLKPLHLVNKGFKLNLYESLEIFKHLKLGAPILNDQQDLVYSPLFQVFC